MMEKKSLLVKYSRKKVPGRIFPGFLFIWLIFSSYQGYAKENLTGEGYLSTEDYDRESRGVVVAMSRAIISSEISARIIQLPFRAGEGFKKGETLVAFDCTLFQAQKEKVKAEYDLAKIKLDNDRKLQSLSSIGKLEIAISEAKMKKTELELKISQLNVKRCHIKAPYDGRIVKLFRNEHESVSQQQELFEIVGTNDLEVELIFPSQKLSELKEDRYFQITIDETGKSIPVVIITAGAVVDPVSQTVSVRARFAEKHHFLLPGMSGTARF
ncbi:efflux RND transporter periplasmic adaptor subunit [Endozoicomonas sp. Mp262]|uniref:efflux RND transporter periplasmic adaptor subunit n=1 Tax=Endozoicomonas sp. Mp262 TaxID=2919499 RepID=UPI0021DB66A2